MSANIARKHVQQSRKNGIINCPTQLHLIGHFYKICTYSLRYCQTILLLAATVEEMELLSSISSTVAANSSIDLQYLKLYVQLCAPDDGRRNRLKHVERL